MYLRPSIAGGFPTQGNLTEIDWYAQHLPKPHPPARPPRLRRLPPLPLLQPRHHPPLFSLLPAPPPKTQVELRYTDPYIGLSSAVLKHPAPITNFPGLLARVNASAPGEVYLEMPHWASNFGTIYSEDRTFVVQSGQDSPNLPIFKFRTIDFGMETCILTLAKNTSAFLFPRPFTLAVWTLAARALLFPHTLALDTCPPRGELLAALPQTPEFACPARTLFPFEVACAYVDAKERKEDGCYLKFVQDDKSRELGARFPFRFRSMASYAASPSDGGNDADA
ncbi:hypothetical protein C8R44DRAFT_888221 [Mycena epipterygia]|nr:hypothetical protein C8R44DRAFT_888221 [Mycena epipterygia]